ncbi:MAG: ornithine carbamoyltransferase [Pseudomonadota bacterium]|jgi:ornithine carbamoyltransferase
MRSLTKIADLSVDDLNAIVDLAERYRVQRLNGDGGEKALNGRFVALVFEKPSLRTKVSFEVATVSLGGHPLFLSSGQIFASGANQSGRESIPDIGRNLERFCDIIVARVYSHATIATLRSVIRVPIINALCDQHHPCQAIADVLTMERLAPRGSNGLKVAYVGDGNNVATSLAQACVIRGHSVVVASPRGYEVSAEEQKVTHSLRVSKAQSIEFIANPAEAVADADIVYTDTFVSMGQEHEHDQRVAAFKGYQVDRALMAKAPSHVKFMHCLPAHRGEEVTDEVMDGPQSVVFDQAESRLYVAKAVLAWSLAA